METRVVAGPAADLSTELTGGRGPFSPMVTAGSLRRLGYLQREYVAAGTATSYRAEGGLGADGRWALVPDATAPYRTRVLVRAPEQPSRFSGCAVVEWLNVSSGLDAEPEWLSLREEIARRGDVWVGVSAQRIGVMGGPTLVGAPGGGPAGQGLRTIDRERYGELDHPGDGFAFDLHTQVARAVRAGAGLDGLRPRTLLAAGESQSAYAMVTYYNGVQPLTGAFDGFLVHSRGASGLPLVGPGEHADLAGSLSREPVTFRTDLAAPVLDIQTETDVVGLLNSAVARQPDGDRFRLWEVAGTAHADRHLVGAAMAAKLDCGAPINDGPMHLVAKAAYAALVAWVQTGTAPPTAPRLELADGRPPQLHRDGDGIAVGGIRTPPVDVPVDVLSGEPGPKPSAICLLLGQTRPLPADRLAARYPSRAEYLRRYTAAVDEAIGAGFVLAADREALLGYADPSRLPD